MTIWLLIIVALGLLLLFVRSHRSPRRKSRSLHRRPLRRASAGFVNGNHHAESYSAVEIIPGDPCCSHVEQLKGKRYLSAEAPEIPLTSWGAENCYCRYKHLVDRREYKERRDAVPIASELYLNAGYEERREHRRGRRASDKEH